MYSIYLKHPQICTDTRKIIPGCLFFSLKGENFDGNRFATQALEQGASYVVTENTELTNHPRCIVVQDSLKALQELDSVEGIGLVEKERQGQGKATRIYVKNFVIEDSQKFTFETSEEKEQDSEVYISNFKKFDFGDSRSLKSKTQEVCFSGANNTNINNTNDSYTESNLIVSADEMGYDASPIFKAYVQLIRENMAVDTLIEREPMDRELLEGIYELVLETVMTSGQEIIIASNRYPAELVKSKFMKLNSGHVEYVVDSLKSNTTKVRNIKKYLLAALFNAPSTISGYYQAEVNHDMPQFARVR